MGLDRLIKGVQAGPVCGLLHALEGWGKSTLGAAAPNAVIVPTEDGIGRIDCTAFPLCQSWDDVSDCLRDLNSEEHNFKWLVIDTIDWAEKFLHQSIAQAAEVNTIDDIKFGRGYSATERYWRDLTAKLSHLKRAGLNILLLAHTKVERFNPPDGDPYDRYTPALHKAASAWLREWSDFVLFGTFEVVTRSVDLGFDKTSNKAIGSGQRILYTSEKPTHKAKNRFGLPAEITLPENPADFWKGFDSYAFRTPKDD